jgi:hypothetical protein
MVQLHQFLSSETFAAVNAIAAQALKAVEQNAAHARYEQAAGHVAGRVIRPLRESVVERHEREAREWSSKTERRIDVTETYLKSSVVFEPTTVVCEKRRPTSGGPRDRDAHLAYQKEYQRTRRTFGVKTAEGTFYYSTRAKANRVRSSFRQFAVLCGPALFRTPAADLADRFAAGLSAHRVLSDLLVEMN